MPDGLTPDVLLKRLLAVHAVASVDDLRGKTKRSVRTLQRWKSAGWPQNVAAALEMLSESGLLVKPDTGEPAERNGVLVPLGALATTVGGLVDLTEEYGRKLKALEDELQRVAAVSGRPGRGSSRSASGR